MPVPVQEELARGEDIAHCPSCSLTVVVIYNQVPDDVPTCNWVCCLLLIVFSPHARNTHTGRTVHTAGS
jgi:hypothetical protein